jgi:hypothetical protein
LASIALKAGSTVQVVVNVTGGAFSSRRAGHTGRGAGNAGSIGVTSSGDLVSKTLKA